MPTIVKFRLLVLSWIFPSFVLLTRMVVAQDAPTDSGALFHQAPLRVVDVFDDTFLTRPAALLEEISVAEAVLDESFEGEALVGWTARGVGVVGQGSGTPVGGAETAPPAPVPTVPPASSDVRIVAEPVREGRRSVLLERLGAAGLFPSLERVVAVRPRATYRLSAFVRTEELLPEGEISAGASVDLSELATVDGPPLVVHQHLPHERGTSSDWKELRYGFTASEATRHLRIVLSGAFGPASGRVFFDEVRLVEIPPLVGLIEGSIFADTTRLKPPHPLVKRLSVDRFDQRPAILAPVPSRWRLPVRAADDTELDLSLALAPQAAADSEVCFRLCWRVAGEVDAEQAAGDGAVCPAEPPALSTDPDELLILDPAAGESSSLEPPSNGFLLARCLRRDELSAGRWNPRRLDLAPWVGRDGELWFETLGTDGAPALWGNPRLVDRRRAAGDTRPNLVLLVFDTLRADHLGAAGYAKPTSPVLDRLAARSVVFERAFSAAPWTAPSLGSLLSGRYPSQHHGGIRIERERRHRHPQAPSEGEASRGWENRLLGELFERATVLNYHPVGGGERMLAEQLRAAGYETFGLHSNYNSSGVLGLSRGFDRYQMVSGISRLGAGEATSRALAWLRERRAAGDDSPFFLLVHTQDAHLPYRLRREQAEIFAPDLDWNAFDDPAGLFRQVQFGGPWALEFWNYGALRDGRANPLIDRVRAFYDAEIAHSDQVMKTLLDRLGDVDDTVIALTADHGEEFGEHEQFEHGHSLYNEVVHVPLWLRLPGDRHAGTRIAEPVSLVDVAPTLLRFAAAEPLPRGEGRPLVPLAGSERPRADLFVEAMLRGPDRTALIDGRHKFLFTHPVGYLVPYPSEHSLEPPGGPHDGREELYDLDVDPSESHDLLGERPELAAALRARLHAFLAETAHGVHLRCGGGEVEIEVATTETLGHVKPLDLEADDEVEIPPSRRRLTLRLAATGEDADWLLLRFVAPGGEVSLRGDRVRFYVGGAEKPSRGGALRLERGSEELVGGILDPPGGRRPWCRIWEVAGADAGTGALDGAMADDLRALGYL